MSDDTDGPVIVWENYGCEGWQPKAIRPSRMRSSPRATTANSCSRSARNSTWSRPTSEKIQHLFPPNYAAINRAFKMRGKPAIFCYGDTIYNPGRIKVPKQLYDRPRYRRPLPDSKNKKHDHQSIVVAT
jgi:hypothetical protein